MGITYGEVEAKRFPKRSSGSEHLSQHAAESLAVAFVAK